MHRSTVLTAYLRRHCGSDFALLATAPITVGEQLELVYPLGQRVLGRHAERLRSAALTRAGEREADDWLMKVAEAGRIEYETPPSDAALKALLERFTHSLFALMSADKANSREVTLHLPASLRREEQAVAALLIALSKH